MSNILSGIPEEALSKAEEAQCVASGDLAGLIEHTLREAFRYAKGCFQSKALSDGEILAAAYDGLLAASKNFDPARIRFFAYAKPYVRGALCKVRKSHEVVKKGGVVEPLPDYDAEIDDEQVELPSAPPKRDLPPHELPDFDAVFLREEWARLAPIFKRVLDARERMIIELHFLGGLNLREIADLLGVSRSDVQHAKQEGFKRVRNRLMELGRYARS